MDNGWVRLIPHPSIGFYYRWWIERTLHQSVNIPYHGYHITVINGRYNDCRKHPAWKKSHHKVVNFSYEHNVQDDSTSYWLTVHSRELEEIRMSLDLYPFPYWPFHLTVGNLKGL